MLVWDQLVQAQHPGAAEKKTEGDDQGSLEIVPGVAEGGYDQGPNRRGDHNPRRKPQ